MECLRMSPERGRVRADLPEGAMWDTVLELWDTVLELVKRLIPVVMLFSIVYAFRGRQPDRPASQLPPRRRPRAQHVVEFQQRPATPRPNGSSARAHPMWDYWLDG